MSVLYEKRGWWYLQWSSEGKRRQKALKTQDRGIAKRLKAIHDARLAVGRAGIGPCRINLAAAIDDFLLLKQSAVVPESHRRLRDHAKHLLCFFELERIRDHLDLAGSVMARYVAFRKENRAAEKTIFEELATLRGVIRSACEERNALPPTFSGWPKMSKRPKRPERLGAYTPEDLRALREHFHRPDSKFTSRPGACRDFAPVFELLLFTGARIGELRDLRVRDVRIEDNFLVLTQSKTGKTAAGMHRTVDIHPAILDLLRSRVVGARSDALVLPELSTHGRHWARDVLREACRRIGIQYRRIHGFRHTFATYALASGISTPELQALIGHHNLSTTEKYVDAAASLRTVRAGRIRFDPEPAG